MKIISWNVNGLRSVVRNGFLDWVKKEDPDILCLQEIKIQENDLQFDLKYLNNYQSFFNCANKKGYASVAVYSKVKPLSVNKTLGVERFDHEGRMLELQFEGFTLLNLYIPHGGRDKHDLAYKLEVYNKLTNKLKDSSARASTELSRTFSGQALKPKKIILSGDFNVAHKDIDLARPGENINNIMFTPFERFQIDKIINIGFIDAYRKFHSEGGKYTWLSYNKNSISNNIGWRIDYFFVNRDLESNLKDAFILSDISLGSDHRPVGVEIF